MHEKFHSIQYLRGIAAMMVVCSHLKEYMNGLFGVKNFGSFLFSHGSFGVDLFFIISGFIINQSTMTRKNNKPADFVVKRIFRIYPVLILCIALICLVGTGIPQIIDLAKGVLLIPLNFDDKGPFFGYNFLYPAWTLTYEMTFYFLFFIAISVNHKYRGAICSAFIIILFLSLNTYSNGGISFKPDTKLNYSFGLLKILASPMLIEFIYGIALSLVINKMQGNKKIILMFFSMAFLFTFIYCFASGIADMGHGPVHYGFAAASLISSALLLEKSGALLKSKILDKLGDISYSLYLSHVIVIYAINKYIFQPMAIDARGDFLAVTFILLLCIVVSLVIYHAVEVRFIKLGRKFITSGKAKIPVNS